MTFTEWYYENYKDDFEGNCRNEYGFAGRVNYEYMDWCKENNLEEVWE
jgi:hypothetical protein